MNPREALYYICLELGPTPATKRDDNITYKEARLRDAVSTLQTLIEESEKQGTPNEDSTDNSAEHEASYREQVEALWRDIASKL